MSLQTANLTYSDVGDRHVLMVVQLRHRQLFWNHWHRANHSAHWGLCLAPCSKISQRISQMTQIEWAIISWDVFALSTRSDFGNGSKPLWGSFDYRSIDNFKLSMVDNIYNNVKLIDQGYSHPFFVLRQQHRYCICLIFCYCWRKRRRDFFIIFGG